MKLRSQLLLVLLSLLILLSGCSRDPNVKKQKFFASGKNYFAKANYQAAAIAYLNAIQIDPQFAEAHYELAQTYVKLGVWKGAYAELMRSVELQPDNVAAHVELGNLLLAARNLDQAGQQAEIALQKDPTNTDALALSANVLAANNRFGDALEQINKAISIAPNNARLYTNLALIQAHQNQLPAAELSLKKTIELEPGSARNHVNLAGLYQQQQNLSAAESEYRKAIELEPKSVSARVAFARFCLSRGDRNTAEHIILDGKQALGDDPAGFRIAADYYLGVGEKDKALAEYASLYERYPKDVEAKKSYIDLLLQNNQIDQAKRLNAEIIKLNSKDTVANTFAADIDLRTGKTDEAITTLQSLLKRDQDNARAHYLLGIAFDRSARVMTLRRNGRKRFAFGRTWSRRTKPWRGLLFELETLTC